LFHADHETVNVIHLSIVQRKACSSTYRNKWNGSTET
jgi:hypothetical protein